jgi:hypothetical protein
MRKHMALLINLAVLHISLILRRRKNRPKYEQRLFALICLGTGSQVPYLMMTPPYPKKKTMINNTSDPKRWDRSLLSCQKQYSSPWTSSGYPPQRVLCHLPPSRILLRGNLPEKASTDLQGFHMPGKGCHRAKGVRGNAR